MLPTWNDDTSAVAAALLQLLTLPISAYLIARATYRSPDIEHRVDDVDELAEAERPRRRDAQRGRGMRTTPARARSAISAAS